MANVELFICGSKKGATENHRLRVYSNVNNEVFLSMDANDGFHSCFITLDKSTAIKFSKELRKSIANLKDEEGIL